jgi:phosphatidylglycerophosphate synthase
LAGLPLILRTAQRIADEIKPERIIFTDAPADFAQRWSRQLASLGAPARFSPDPPDLQTQLLPGTPVITVTGKGLPAPGALHRFLLAAAKTGRTLSWGRDAKATFHPTVESLLSGVDSTAPEWDANEEDWIGPEAPVKLENSLFEGLVKENDGYIARFDRRISLALSKLMIRTPITPNAITLASLILGLLGAAALAFGTYRIQVLGTSVLWFCGILDGCDGEVARLKLLCSHTGAFLDLAADHLAHLAIFLAIPLAVLHSHPEANVLLPGALLFTGLIASMATVWWVILRRPEHDRGRLGLFLERLASRDYVYLILILVVINRLDWFLWTAGFGAYAFTLAIGWMHLRQRASQAA